MTNLVVSKLRQFCDERKDTAPNQVRVAEFILANGRPFTPGPESVELGAPRGCFLNVYGRARAHEGDYVEGFALHTDDYFPSHHAWLSTNGAEAIEVTWRRPGLSYFGIVVPLALLTSTFKHRGGKFGMLWPLDEHVRRALTATSVTPAFAV